jgi:hypothetical protein
MAYVQYSVSISLADLIMHNGQTSDPLNVYAKRMKAISGKRKKVDADFEALALIEYEAGLYLNNEEEAIIPGRLFEAMIAEGAKKSKEGKLALSGTFVDNDAVISYDGGPLTLEELKASSKHRLAVGVRVGMSKVTRTRPHFHNVRATFLVSLNTEVANGEQLRKWIEDGLTLVGIGDWRPRHGRGSLDRFEVVRAPLTAVA